MEEKTVDFSKVEERLDTQNGTLSKILEELTELNDSAAKERDEAKEKEVEQAKIAEEEKAKESSEVSTDQLILDELKALNKFNSDNLDTEQREKLHNLIVKLDKDYDSFYLSNSTELYYGLFTVPIVLFLMLIYKVLKIFIW